MQPVQIVAEEANSNSKAILQRFAKVGDSVSIGVTQQPKVGDVRIPNVAAARQNAGGDAVGWPIETFGENGRVIGFAVTITILHHSDALALPGISREPLTQVALHLPQTILHGAAGQIFIQPAHQMADVVHSGAEPERLADVSPAPF